MSIDQRHDKPRENNRRSELSTDTPCGALRKRGVSRRKLFQAAISGTVALGLGARPSRSSAMTRDIVGWKELREDDWNDIDNSIKWLQDTLGNFYENATRAKWIKRMQTDCLRAFWRRYPRDTAIVVAFNRRLLCHAPCWYLSVGFSTDYYDVNTVLGDVNQLCLDVHLPDYGTRIMKVGIRTDHTEAQIKASRLGKLFTAAVDNGFLGDQGGLEPATFVKGTMVWPAMNERQLLRA